MKKVFKTLTIIILVFLYGCKNQKDLVTIKIKTDSQSETVKSNYTVEEWNENTKLISISFTNNGDKTELIKDIHITLNNAPQFGEQSKFIYGGSCMGRTPIQQRSYKDSIQLETETFLLAQNDQNVLYKVGILTWEIFQAEISFDKSQGVIVVANGENKPIKPGETIQFEKLVVENGENWQDMLYAYGEQIAKIHNIQPKKIIPFKGWSTWDYYGQRFTDKEIAMNIKLIKELDVDANSIQIDGGWWNHRGDYLESRSDIDGGMKGVAQMIKDNGYTAGIHLDGFRGEKAAEVFKAHPDYFLKDQNGEHFYTESERPNRTEYTVCFDYSNPAAREYIKNVLKTIKEDWGFNYFKIDFMRYGINSDILKAHKKYGLTEIKAFDPSMTSLERSRAGLKAMREGMGDAFFLGCSSRFGVTLGIVDGLRTGGDIDPLYDSYIGRCIQNGGNFYLNKTVVQNDADYLVLRNKDDEEADRAWSVGRKFGGDVTLNEAAMWADYVTLFGGIKMSSDNLNVLRPERQDLIKKAYSINTCERFIPIDLMDKAKDKEDAFNIMLGTNEEGVYLALFNWNDEELGFNLSNISSDSIKVVNHEEYPAFTTEDNTLNIKLKARTSLIFKLNKDADFDKVRKEMQYEFYN